MKTTPQRPFPHGWLPTIRGSAYREIRRPGFSYCYDRKFHGEGDFVILQLTLAGHGEFVSGRTYRLSPGDLFVVVPHRDFRYSLPAHQTEPWEFAWMHLEGKAVGQLWGDVVDEWGPVLRLTTPGRARKIFREITKKRQVWNPPPTPTEEAVEITRLLFAVSEEADGRPAEIESPFHQLARLVKADPGRPMVVKEWADSLKLSREHFTRRFREEIGESPASYLRRHRLRKAVDLLRRTNLSVEEVAREAGFTEVRTFQRAFRQAYHQSPLSSRNQAS